MRNIKIITVAFFIGLLCLNADCNKVEETPPVNEFFIIEGRLVNSCTDNSPIKNSSFDLVGYNFAERISTTTDSNGYFKFYSKFKDKTLLMRESGGRYILANVPGNKNLNVGVIAYNFIISVTLVYKKFLDITSNDSLRFQYSGGNPNVWKFFKGPLNNEVIGVINISSTPMFNNSDSITGNVSMSINGVTQPQTKKYIISPCGVTHKLIFE